LDGGRAQLARIQRAEPALQRRHDMTAPRRAGAVADDLQREREARRADGRDDVAQLLVQPPLRERQRRVATDDGRLQPAALAPAREDEVLAALAGFPADVDRHLEAAAA